MDDTKIKMLEATERLIMEYGWEKVTFRMITAEAGVNLAAINYHFGSREALEDALLPRFIGPLDEKQSEQLREAEKKASPNQLELKDIIRCFLEPVLEFSLAYPNHFRMIHGFFSGIKDKSKIKKHILENVNVVSGQFTEALFKTLPDAPREKVLVFFVMLFDSSRIFLNNEVFEGLTESVGLSITKEVFLDDIIALYSAGLRKLIEDAKNSDIE